MSFSIYYLICLFLDLTQGHSINVENLLLKRNDNDDFNHLYVKEPNLLPLFSAHSVGAEALMKLLGGKVTLNCSFPSSIKEEPDKVIWQLNNNNLIVDGTRLKKISASVLEISDLQYRDSGLYACFVESKLVNKTLLIVEGKKMFICFLFVFLFTFSICCEIHNDSTLF